MVRGMVRWISYGIELKELLIHGLTTDFGMHTHEW